jgi:hypothetical protein
VKRAFPAGQALHDHARGFIDEYAHKTSSLVVGRWPLVIVADNPLPTTKDND